MNRITKLVYLLVGTSVVIACSSKTDDKVILKFAEDFATSLQRNDKATINDSYPDAAYIDSMSISYEPHGITVDATKADSDIYKVSYNNFQDIELVGDGNGNFKIRNSHGLLVLRKADIGFAEATGWISKELTDKENAERYKDKGFRDYLKSKLMGNLKRSLKVSTKCEDISNAEPWVNNGRCIITVSNKSDITVKGSYYTVKVNVLPLLGTHDSEDGTFAGYTIAPGAEVSKTFQGKEITAHSSVQYSFTFGHAFGANSNASINWNLTEEEILKNYHPRGNEYKDYKKI